MKIYSFVSGVIFFISLILVSFPQDLWLILLYWNEPSFAKNLYYFFGNRLFFEDFFYKIFLLIWLPFKYTLLTYAVFSVDHYIKSIRYGSLRFIVYFVLSACVFVLSIMMYLLKVRGCCMA